MEKEKNHRNKESEVENQEESSKDAMILRKRVKSLIKKNRVIEVQKLVRTEEYKAWGRDTQAKVPKNRISSK